MAKHIPPTDQELHAIEALAVDATPGPWEPQVVMDYQTGESARVVVHTPAENELQYVVERDHDLAEADQAYIAAMHPDAALRLVREIRRLRRVQERYDMMCDMLQHLDAFLERRGLVAQAQRFVEVRAQMERIHPDGADAAAAGRAGADRRPAVTA
ncbi:MAG TPA: hypothetical protein VLK84_12210 [Longimicrobium sp.]|nr:hypothetical protein [Longimicrobium sp.]